MNSIWISYLWLWTVYYNNMIGIHYSFYWFMTCFDTSSQLELATTVILMTLISTWFSAAPFRIFAFIPLGPWRQTELGSWMNPLLSRLITSVGQRTRPSWAGASLSLLSSWKCHVYHSIQVRSTTETGLRIRVRWRRKPGIAQGQPCVWDQHLAVELWQAPASCWWTFGGQNRRDSQTFQFRNVPARLEDPAGPAGPEACRRRGGVQLKWYDIHIPVIYLSYMNAH